MREKWTYSHDDVGELSKEVYEKNGATIKVSHYSGKNRTEELYRDSSPFLRVFYTGKERVGEEFIDGRQ